MDHIQYLNSRFFSMKFCIEYNYKETVKLSTDFLWEIEGIMLFSSFDILSSFWLKNRHGRHAGAKWSRASISNQKVWLTRFISPFGATVILKSCFHNLQAWTPPPTLKNSRCIIIRGVPGISSVLLQVQKLFRRFVYRSYILQFLLKFQGKYVVGHNFPANYLCNARVM